jgi:plasmid stabilization system protein ParE
LAIERAIEEASFIALDKPEAADRWLDGLFATVERLEMFPSSGHAVPELRSSKYRQIVYQSHRVIFSISDAVVRIHTVRRSKRRLDVSELA